MSKQTNIQQIRQFNRYYTNILGLLNKGILNSPYSLSEVRILHEIGELKSCTAKDLIHIVSLDKSYLSRMLKSFERQGIIEKEKSSIDGRYYYLHLTNQGQKLVDEFNQKSDQQIDDMIKHLNSQELNTLVNNMKQIKILLEKG